MIVQFQDDNLSWLWVHRFSVGNGSGCQFSRSRDRFYDMQRYITTFYEETLHIGQLDHRLVSLYLDRSVAFSLCHYIKCHASPDNVVRAG